MNKLIQDTGGSVSIIVGILIVVLMGLLGLAVVVGYLAVQKNRLQNTSDAAALACVIHDSNDACGVFPNPSDIPVNDKILIRDLTKRLYDNHTIHTTLPVPCPNTATQFNCAQAIASTQFNPFFMGLLGKDTVDLASLSIAGRTRPSPSCLVSMQDFTINGTNVTTLNNCSAVIGGNLINKNTNQAAIVASGSGSSILVYGNKTPDCPNCSPKPMMRSDPFPLIPMVTIPTNNIDGNPLVLRSNSDCGSKGTCLPGIYTSEIIINSYTSFSSGIYIFQNGLINKNQGSMVGTNLAIYIPKGSPGFVNDGEIALTAYTPNNGNCNPGSGIVLFQDSSITSTWNIPGNRKISLDGISYLQGVDIRFNGTSTDFIVKGSIVANSFDLRGNTASSVSSNPCNNLELGAGRPILVN
jgi:hypothetical protein